ncbi:MAG: hypothetical protein NTW37_09555 [Proteobacteria bacterium]|nr:hypothetical protein [Pseudomonadota bacterium]
MTAMYCSCQRNGERESDTHQADRTCRRMERALDRQDPEPAHRRRGREVDRRRAQAEQRQREGVRGLREHLRRQRQLLQEGRRAHAHAVDVVALLFERGGRVHEAVVDVDQRDRQGIVASAQLEGLEVQACVAHLLDQHAGVAVAGLAAPDGACQRREAAYPQLSVLDEGLAQAACGRSDHQRRCAIDAEPFGQRRHHQRQQIEAHERDLRLLDRFRPGREQIGVRQRGEQVAVIAPLLALAPLQHRRVVRRIPVQLAQPALDQRCAFPAAGMRQQFGAVIFFDRVDQRLDRQPAIGRECRTEAPQAVLVAGEGFATDQPFAAPASECRLASADAEQQPFADRHVRRPPGERPSGSGGLVRLPSVSGEGSSQLQFAKDVVYR